MIDAKQLLDAVLGGQATQGLGQVANQARDRLNQAGGAQAFGAGALSGGLLGLLVGSKKVRKMAGGAIGYGGAAVLGAIAYRAWQNYSQRQTGGSLQPAAPAEVPQNLLPHATPATDGSPFELVLVEGMIAAAKADGEIDPAEQKRVFAEVERLGLDGTAKARVFDALAGHADPSRLAARVATPEQAAELYLASRLAIDPDNAAEHAYLDALAARLKLPVEVRGTLDRAAAEQAAS